MEEGVENICVIENLCKSYGNKKIFDDFFMEAKSGEILSISGPSGSGKSTLLNIIGMFEKPDEGNIELFGRKVSELKKKHIEQLRRERIFYVFQNYALIDEKSIEYNLNIPMIGKKGDRKEKRRKMKEALEKVGLNIPLEEKIFKLSGGEQQRVAIARGFLREFEIILADEPTGSLDQENKQRVMDILKQFNRKGKTVIIVTHDPDIIDGCSRNIELT